MAGRVLTVAQQKGGAGKTTVAAQLGIAWAGRGLRVALVDIDPQASLAVWHRVREDRLGAGRTGLTFSALTGWRATTEVERLALSHDLVIVDSPPHAETEARIAVRAATLVLVPVQPSPFDLWATQPTLDLARRERRPALLVLNRVPSRTRLTEEMLEKLRELDAEVAEASLGSRVGFASSLAAGLGVSEAAASSPAAREIEALASEILARTDRRAA
jgi:chromosome partitioning protein